MADRQKIKSIFDQLKHDPNHHLGLGDIRLTVGQQDEIINLFPETTPPKNTISSDRQKAEELREQFFKEAMETLGGKIEIR